MKVMISQSNYIPWRGFFDAINQVDLYLIYDEVQYTRRDWRSRNRVKTPEGAQWLAVPVEVKGRYHQTIQETRIADPHWGATHWKTLMACYGRAPFFRTLGPRFESLYHAPVSNYLSEVNRSLLEAVCSVLGITTVLRWSRDIPVIAEGRNERLLQLCQHVGATEYWSGPSARAYLDESMFARLGMKVRYFDYSGYPEYQQRFGPFVPEVTVLDLLFNTGPAAPRFMKSFTPSVLL